MKTILVLTDFSRRAERAALYAYAIARKMLANVLLCNVVEVPEQIPLPSNSQWGADYSTLKEESLAELSQLAGHLKNLPVEDGDSFDPEIEFVSYIGLLPDVVNDLIIQRGIDLIVMGSHHSNTFKRLLLGSDTYEVLDKVKRPVMLIPEKVTFKDIRSITYATDLTYGDLNVLRSLVKLAAPFRAKIFVSNVSSNVSVSAAGGITLEELKNEVTPQIGYSEIYYNNIIGTNVPQSLLDVSISSKMDILTVVHRRNGFFDNFFQSSVSKKLANSAKIPLIIFPQYFNIQISDFFESGAGHTHF